MFLQKRLTIITLCLVTFSYGCASRYDGSHAKLKPLEISVAVDENFCAAEPGQCSGGGHSNGAGASNSNHNPVLISFLVTRNGKPVPGIPFNDFDFKNLFPPAGGPFIVLCPVGGTGCGSAASFTDFGNGVYFVLAHPIPVSINWKSGQYISRLLATDATGAVGAALVEVVIP